MTVVILAALLLLGILIGVLFRARQGTVRPAGGVAADLVDPVARVTVVQLSTPMCARCPGTARLASEVVGERPGAHHHEINLVERPDIADRFHIASTPTLLLVDASGEVRRRIVGAPAGRDLARAIDDLLEVPA